MSTSRASWSPPGVIARVSSLLQLSKSREAWCKEEREGQLVSATRIATPQLLLFCHATALAFPSHHCRLCVSTFSLLLPNGIHVRPTS